MRLFGMVVMLSFALTGCGGTAPIASAFDPAGPWQWTFDSSNQTDDPVTFNLVLEENGGVVRPQFGTTITVTGGNTAGQCTTPPSFTARVASGTLIRGTAVSCNGTFAFTGTLTNVINGTFASNGWGAPGGNFQATQQPRGANTSTGSNIFIGPTTFDGSITSSGSNLFTGQNTFRSQGVFGNSQPNDFVQSLLNSCNPGTEFQIVQGRQNDTAAYTGCVTVPANSTVHQASAVAGFVNNASPSTNAVGGYFQAVNNVSNGYIWGINPLIASVPGKPTAKMQNEFDVNVSNTSDQGAGITFNGLWTAQPTMDPSYATAGAMPAVVIGSTNSNHGWTAGWVCPWGGAGSQTLHPSAACVLMEPKTPANTQQSWPIVFVGTTSGGTHPYAKLYEDSTGNFTIANSNTIMQGLNLNTQSSSATLRQMEVVHVDTCTTAALAGSTCTTSATWAHAFMDTNYVIECTLEAATNTPVIIDTEGKNPSGFVLKIATISSAASLGTAQCIGLHLN
jgi:hypothetical protein